MVYVHFQIKIVKIIATKFRGIQSHKWHWLASTKDVAQNILSGEGVNLWFLTNKWCDQGLRENN